MHQQQIKTSTRPREEIYHSPFYVKYSSVISIFFIDIVMSPSTIVFLSLQSFLYFSLTLFATIHNCVALLTHSLNHFFKRRSHTSNCNNVCISTDSPIQRYACKHPDANNRRGKTNDKTKCAIFINLYAWELEACFYIYCSNVYFIHWVVILVL